MYKVEEIIQALGSHEDSSSINILEEVGTNSNEENIRKLTAEALVKRNCHESLKVVLINKGKGIHDLSLEVSNCVIKTLKGLEDKSEACKILEDTINMHSDEKVRQKAREVKEVICCV